ncbi:MAG: DUF4105 domain-containing protein [Planctomycetota bacterium]
MALLSWGTVALALDGPGRVAAGVYALGSLALLVLVRSHLRAWLACGGLFGIVLCWWLTIEPRNDREWLPDVALLPSARIDGDLLTFTNVRNFEYRTEQDFTPRWENRTVDLTQVRGVDLAVCDWGATGIVHTMLSWEFAHGEPLAISIETRKEVGESYSALRGFFRQFELYYVVGDERDLIGVRTNLRSERVRLYRLALPPAEASELLVSYARRIERLTVEPEWYNAVTHNCTTSIRLHAVELGIERPWDWRILVNGRGEELLHSRGMVDTSRPFAELRALSDVTELARAAGVVPEFSLRIRANLPPRPPGR